MVKNRNYIGNIKVLNTREQNKIKNKTENKIKNKIKNKIENRN